MGHRVEVTRRIESKPLTSCTMRFALLTLVLLPLSAFGQAPNYTRTDDVIYGRKFGTALTMDVFAPKDFSAPASNIPELRGA